MSGLQDLLNKDTLSVGLFGLGKSNLGVLEYLRQRNPNLKLTVRSDAPLSENILGAQRVFSEKNALLNIDEDILFLSPSVRRDRPELVNAKERGVLLSSDAEMFFALFQKNVVCVTGSDGKSTTTKLISDTLRISGKDALPCGNFGRSLSSLIDVNCFPVVELSSFQLSYLTPRVSRAVITNVTPNHLNWHSSFDEYVTAKMNVAKNADKVIFDADCELLRNRFKRTEVFAKTSLDSSYESLKSRGGTKNYVTLANSTVYLNGSPTFNLSEAKKKEPYTLRNFLLAAAACFDLCESHDIERALTSFTGLPHRAETFFERDGIRYVDSSIDSSPERTLKTLSAISGNVIAIIGGMGKGLPIDSLVRALPSLTKGAVLLGEIGDSLCKALEKDANDYEYIRATDMRDAVMKAHSLTSVPSTVILSPAATSFDNYKNFEERGNDFKSIVLSLFA